MSDNQKLFTKEILLEKMSVKAVDRYPFDAERLTGRQILNQIGSAGVMDLAIEVLCEELNEIRIELRRKI